ncbi:VCBS repeat-containing protein [Nocardioides sp. zg-536]|uniref:VCBS repeat-containing protein n=1 Tax=Nocardioides faecalis TaxID=2803858 RepID=A0A939BZR8_9ACTN|nr:VCBS repeat-containing protein [Nocardioides faecalis]MBM9461593.1 VCBS repeat-containing protein [Nocardioides faecalis]QVI57774.1 VCBS repeat-containing protein [Nocardioides faecalis]
MARLPVRVRRLLVGGVAGLVAASVAPALQAPVARGDAPADAPEATVFSRVDVDTVPGASFTVVGEVFAGEKNLVVSGYGALNSSGAPQGGGTLQVYRPGAYIGQWTKVSVITPGDGIVFPNQVTLTDMDGDGDTDLLLPSGYFFDRDQPRSAITWWENRGVGADDVARPFVRHDVITGQLGSYHGVQHVDLDGDGRKDLVTTSEAGRVAANLDDDIVALQVFRGLAGGKFAAPVTIGTEGGSIPVVADVDGDGRLDIASSQYFGTGSMADNPTRASFLWWRQTGDLSDGIAAGDFTMHVIATLAQTGPGFQIRPVPDFRGDGRTVWVGTNHTGRCTFSTPQPAEGVFELTPGEAITEPWGITRLSTPANPDPSCPAEFKNDRNMIFPGDDITSRAVPGQAAPGVFGYGDVDGDGDIDLAVSGDGDHRLFWIEQREDGSTRLHTLTAPGERFGQSGGAVVADLDGDDAAELVFSSFDRNAVAIWRSGAPLESVVVPSTLRVSGAGTVRAGQQTDLTATLTGLDTQVPAERPALRVTFTPARTGKPVLRGILALARTRKGTFVGRWRERVAQAGTYRFHYAGRKNDPLMQAGAASYDVRVAARSVLTNLSVPRKPTSKKRVKVSGSVLPAVGRKVRLQRSSCVRKRGERVCTWRTVKTTRTSTAGRFSFTTRVPRGKSRWRVVVAADASGTALTSSVRVVRRR